MTGFHHMPPTRKKRGNDLQAKLKGYYLAEGPYAYLHLEGAWSILKRIILRRSYHDKIQS